MSSGHTGKSGRGNRRARRGSQRPRGPDGQNGQGQTHSSSAMLILSSGARQAPAHEPREPKEPRDISRDNEDTVMEDDAMREADLELADEGMSADAGASDATSAPNAAAGREREVVVYTAEAEDSAAAASQDAVTRAHARQDRRERHNAHVENAAHAVHPAYAPHEEQHGPASTLPGGGARGPHERGQPYAPGMRAQISRSAQTARPRHAPPTDAEAGASARWVEHEESRDVPLTPSRPPRAEHDDWGDSGERGDHPPLRPEVRGEVGPLIDALHGLFEQDRATASQGGTTRCGICYLHFALADLEYREAEGFYVCRGCARLLGNTHLPMVRRQQRV